MESKNQKDREMGSKGAGFLSRSVEELWKNESAPLSVLIANSFLLARSETPVEKEHLLKPASPVSDADIKLVKDLVRKAMLPGVPLVDLLRSELERVWVRKRGIIQKNENLTAIKKVIKKKPTNTKVSRNGMVSEQKIKPVIVIKKSRLPSV